MPTIAPLPSTRFAAWREQACGLQPEQLRLGGPTVDAATIDVESQRMLLELAGLSGLVALAITWVRLRSVRLAVIILVVAVYSTAVALAILYYYRRQHESGHDHVAAADFRAEHLDGDPPGQLLS